ncbi:MAG TPA: hypothetical protein PLP27_05245 [Crocinitomicaceae bacterium]|jgi:hypothetical protein|nr:hypothetical protein [Crocinitomicaceae bacterium]
MKTLKLILILSFFVPTLCLAQKKKADKDTQQWRYEIQATDQQSSQGTYQIKVWSYSKNADVATEQAKKNAVHGIIFRGFPANGRVQGQKALTNNPNLEQEQESFFKDFFNTGGKYLKYVSLVNNGAIAAGDRIKISKKEYKVGVVITVNVSELRKDLENAGIIKKLDAGF